MKNIIVKEKQPALDKIVTFKAYNSFVDFLDNEAQKRRCSRSELIKAVLENFKNEVQGNA